MKYAPIVLFTYNRIRNTRDTIECLLKNREAVLSDLYIYSDAAKNNTAKDKVAEVRQYIHNLSGFNSITIIERDKNWGLAKNIVDGVTTIVNKYGKVIVLEDDHSVSPYFLKYMNEGLERYKNNEDIISIHGYMYPHREKLPEAFLIKGADCWSWATWKRGWSLFSFDANKLYSEIKKSHKVREFDFNYSYHYLKMLKRQTKGVANSWAICWYASAFLNNKYTLYPGQSLMQLNDADGEEATHGSCNTKFIVDLKEEPINWDLVDDKAECKAGRLAFETFFKSIRTLKRRIYDIVMIPIRIFS